MFRFEGLEIWKAAVNYGNKIYNIADLLPKKEMFGLGSQLRRAAVSISLNIAEGSGGTTNKDFRNFLDIAIKSTLETVSALIFAETRKYIRPTIRIDLYSEAEILIKRMNAFKKSLK